jgi:hypothetical protein
MIRHHLENLQRLLGCQSRLGVEEFRGPRKRVSQAAPLLYPSWPGVDFAFKSLF